MAQSREITHNRSLHIPHKKNRTKQTNLHPHALTLHFVILPVWCSSDNGQRAYHASSEGEIYIMVTYGVIPVTRCARGPQHGWRDTNRFCGPASLKYIGMRSPILCFGKS